MIFFLGLIFYMKWYWIVHFKWDMREAHIFFIHIHVQSWIWLHCSARLWAWLSVCFCFRRRRRMTMKLGCWGDQTMCHPLILVLKEWRTISQTPLKQKVRSRWSMCMMSMTEHAHMFAVYFTSALRAYMIIHI